MEKGGGGGGGGGGLSLDTPSYLIKRKQQQQQQLDFPMSLNSHFRDEKESKRVDVEMDFFSAEKRSRPAPASADADLSVKKELDLTINTGLNLLTTAKTGSDQSTVDDGSSMNEDDKDGKSELAVMQAELARMSEENQRLRGVLSQVTNNYNALQMHFYTLMQQRSQHANNNNSTGHGGSVNEVRGHNDEKTSAKGNEQDRSVVPRQFMDLGPVAADAQDEPSHSSTEAGSPDRSSSPAANKEIAQSNGNGNLANSKANEQAQEATMRKARVSVRARSEAPMITDGCQWRKYGQKMAKGNPCPRAYYRCTMATGCPVRKQVQRCADDRSILITTYEGNHNHPLPPAAMAMASTTSAAASMLLSGSMSSADGLMNSNFLARTVLPCSSSMATISASAPFPTVTLDLTQTPNPLQLQRPPPSQFQFNFPGGAPPQQPPTLPQVFGQTLYDNRSKFSGLQMSPDMDSAQLAHLKSAQPAPQSLADTVSAATAAITADPSFTAALAAAITSIIGGGSPNNSNNNNSNSSNKPSSSSFPAS